MQNNILIRMWSDDINMLVLLIGFKCGNHGDKKIGDLKEKKNEG